ncbi:hypothetical protein BO70DRAFT_428844 [Aspergillus heteromorphus CBS 117.55]|uniref:Uncharacterized protein n=1 Tax=Aspergillus heteromorphus CBS 117.55 TaxID=1448321 RepID=A0A317WB51_9EURO|nr:uncharacterized protein BO70DRAFT_428844 [Aspergillus heteromorphus CBS 117.55]PWY83573.1 hypothetical protein BO70DRAFT_428844 [Aspergillus heteromorphus CBS 117.55]
MPTLSGLYTSFSGRTLTIDEGNRLILLPKDGRPDTIDSLRADGEFWLCRNDGLIGKFGNPTKIVFQDQDQGYHIWVEPRGFSDGANEYGLIPILPGGEYSNRFLAVNDALDRLEVVDSWTREAMFRCVE